ncbi:MAG: helix-turn-helix transcriptional regulator [Ruminococcaceae bacterium]|jgi:transcriptional regulator with XRE-family HTH domain|nr:helix-turn-helix transcriptional regulator [Oscillospiraceae bacterium]
MEQLGSKIARKRKNLGLTQTEFAEKLSVTRQTVGRWEAGTVMPDIDKIGDIAALLGVSCDYLLRDDIREETGTAGSRGISRLLLAAQGRQVKLRFFEDEADVDLVNRTCTVTGFEGSWMKLTVDTKREVLEKLIPVSSILSLEIVQEG